MKPRCLLLLVFVAARCLAQSTTSGFDAGWKFFKGDAPGAAQAEYDDRSWRTLDLPHDWSIEDLPDQSDSVVGPFSSKSIGSTATGYTVGGIGWYRKHFVVERRDGRYISLLFDGVYMNADVWLNGHHLGNHPYGYTPFFFDLGPYLLTGSDNVVAVRVANTGRNSRWYSGSGIYRHVWLRQTNSVHILQWGLTSLTKAIDGKTAIVLVGIRTTANLPANYKVQFRILNGRNTVVATGDAKVESPDVDSIRSALVRVASPELWSTAHPYLYTLVAEITSGGRVVDRQSTIFGIRTISVNAENGLLINGKPVKLKGGCVHHDNGPLGAAAIDRAEERRVELLKAAGFNAIRTSHNPPSPAFLDACDRLGMLVIDEFSDCWKEGKNPDDYHQYFADWWERDVSAFVGRDRNHPSVIFWSIGNEIPERADTSGLMTGAKLVNRFHLLDSSRPVTEAICEFWDHPGRPWDSTAPAFGLLDVGGYNYQFGRYEADHEKYPGRIMMGTESVPLDALGNWEAVEKHSYVIGDFVWTAMDYLGETGIGHTDRDRNSGFVKPWPWFNAWCGDIDITGGKKPQSFYRDVVWRQRKLAMLV
ncbi:MAG TPA: glycoside hydrolase family 2 TIM barrel-domain containing protein, partial [Chitinophagaceae bacterium]